MAQKNLWAWGLQTNRPPPGIKSRIYIGYDQGQWNLDTGTTWETANLNPRGAYNAGTTYQKKDLVLYDGEQWLALDVVTGVTPVEGASWTKFVSKGPAGPVGLFAAIRVIGPETLQGTLDAALTQAGSTDEAYMPGASEVNLTCNVATAGAGELRAQYSTNSGSTWNYLSATGTGPLVSTSTTGLKDSGWVEIASGAKAAVRLRLVSINGTGATVSLDEVVVRVRGGGTVSTTDHNLLTNRSVADQHAASAITNMPAGNIVATNLQAAVNELDTEKATTAHAATHSSGGSDQMSHNNLAGLTTGDPHTQYPLADGTRLDSMLQLSRTEVSITGATTLTSTAFGKMHNCSGTTADYTVNLPTAVGNAGKVIAVRGDSALTKVVTLDANSTETIGGNLTKAIVSRQKTIIVSDGSNWYILHDYRLPAPNTQGAAWNFVHTATAGNINTFVQDTNVQITVPALGPAPEGYSWRILLTGGTRWTAVGTGSPLLLLSFDGTGVYGGSLWPGNQTYLPWIAIMTPASPSASSTYTLYMYCSVATTYTLVAGTLIAIPILV